MTHNILVNAYCIAPDRIVAGTAGSYGLERMALTFSEEWKDVAKTVTFYPPKSRPVSVVLADGDEFDIPPEATAKSGEISFTVLGYRDGKRIFSVTGEMLVLATKNKEGVPSEEPTPSEKEQILAYVQDVKEMIDAGKIKGEDGYTPIKGVDYFDGKDGYTPIKGVDYFDGRDGYTPVKGVDYFDGEKGNDGYTPVKGIDYFDGKDGRDGQDGKDGADNLLVVTVNGNYKASHTASEINTFVQGGGSAVLVWFSNVFQAKIITASKCQFGAMFNATTGATEWVMDVDASGTATFSSVVLDSLKNPNAITFTGAVEATYDGSKPVEVEIPEGGGGNSVYFSEEEPTDAKTGDFWYDESEGDVSEGVIGGGGGISKTSKTLLIAILRNGVYTSNQKANIDALEAELNKTSGDDDTGGDNAGGESGGDDTGGGETEVTLTSISATYTGGDVVVGTALTDLSGIVVTATYSNGTTEEVTDYTLTGTIAEGINTITVVYEGKTATFTVNGVRDVWSYDISKLNVLKCSTGWDVANEICLNMSTMQQSRRRSYLLTSGAKCCKKTTNGTTWEDSEYYPIPIPDTATRVDVRIEPSTQYVGLVVLEYDPNTDTYTRMQDPGWSLGNAYAVFTAKENQYLTVASKYDSSGTQYPVEPTAITVTFGVASDEDTHEPNGVWLTGCSGSTRGSNDPTALIYNNNTARATYVSTSGSVGIQYFNGSTFSDCPYYPVLIPAGKRNVTVSCEGYTWGIAYLQVQNGKWVRIADPGWQTLNGSTHTITDINAEAVFINLKVGTAGTESITNVPDTVTVTFS